MTEGRGSGDTGLTSISADSATDIWSVGWANGFTLSVHGDGSSWRPVATPNPPGAGFSELDSVSADRRDDAWAVGQWGDSPIEFPRYSLIEHWDGKQWTIVDGPNPGAQTTELRGVLALSPRNVWAVGEFDGQGLVEHYNGRKWSIASTDGPMLSAVSADSPTSVWVVGGWYESSQPPFAEHWDGSTWRATDITGPRADNYLIGVTALAPDDVWAVGASQRKDYRATATLIEHWDGTSWTVVRSPNPPNHNNLLVGIDASSPTDVWTVGIRGYGGRNHGLSMHWDGQRWKRGSVE